MNTPAYYLTHDERVIKSNKFAFVKQDGISSLESYNPIDIKEFDQFVYHGNRIESFVDDFAREGDVIVIQHEYNASFYRLTYSVYHRSLSVSFANHTDLSTPVNFDKNMELYRKLSLYDQNKVCEYFYKRYTNKPLSFDSDVGIWKLFIKRLRVEKNRSVTNTDYIDDQIAELYSKIKTRRELNINQGYLGAVNHFDLFTAFLNNDMEKLRVASEDVLESMYTNYGITIMVGDFWHLRSDPSKCVEIKSIAKNIDRRGYTIVYYVEDNLFAIDMDDFRNQYDLHEIDITIFDFDDGRNCDCCDY